MNIHIPSKKKKLNPYQIIFLFLDSIVEYNNYVTIVGYSIYNLRVKNKHNLVLISNKGFNSKPDGYIEFDTSNSLEFSSY